MTLGKDDYIISAPLEPQPLGDAWAFVHAVGYTTGGISTRQRLPEERISGDHVSGHFSGSVVGIWTARRFLVRMECPTCGKSVQLNGLSKFDGWNWERNFPGYVPECRHVFMEPATETRPERRYPYTVPMVPSARSDWDAHDSGVPYSKEST